MRKEFTLYHAQMDYETNIVDVQYEGDYDEDNHKMIVIRYAKESYPNLQGVIVSFCPSSESKGYSNMGIIGIK
jgi:hypothetical protein